MKVNDIVENLPLEEIQKAFDENGVKEVLQPNNHDLNEENGDIKIENNSDQETINGIFENPDFQRMWIKMHTPYQRKEIKVGRNDICPFCNSGKKFKNCECYKVMNQKAEY